GAVLDELAVFQRTLTEQEIAAIRAMGASGRPLTLRAGSAIASTADLPFGDPAKTRPPEDADSLLKDPPSSDPVLRLTGGDYVELADTSDVMPAKEFVWIDDAP